MFWILAVARVKVGDADVTRNKVVYSIKVILTVSIISQATGPGNRLVAIIDILLSRRKTQYSTF